MLRHRPAWMVALVAPLVVAGCASASGRRPTVAGAGRTPSATASVPASVAPSVPVESGTTTATAAGPPASAAATAAGRAAQLAAVVADAAAAQRVPFSIVAEDLSPGGGPAAAVEPDRQVLSASLYKLFVARELLRRIAAGSLDPDAAAGDGEGRTVGQCIRAMIVVSDNACGLAGLAMIGSGEQDAGLAADGYVSTSLEDPQRTSAADVALFLRRARDGTLLGPGDEAYTAELYGLLAAQQVDDRFPQGLPPGTPIAHKTGDRLGWAHDAGIITTPNGDLLLVALSGPWPSPCCDADNPGPLEDEAFRAMAALAGRAYAVMAG